MFLRRSSRQGKSHARVLAPNCWLNQARADSTRAAGGCSAGSNWVRLPAGQAGEVLLQHRKTLLVSRCWHRCPTKSEDFSEKSKD
jgi:hypothetical protein